MNMYKLGKIFQQNKVIVKKYELQHSYIRILIHV